MTENTPTPSDDDVREFVRLGAQQFHPHIADSVTLGAFDRWLAARDACVLRAAVERMERSLRRYGTVGTEYAKTANYLLAQLAADADRMEPK